MRDIVVADYQEAVRMSKCSGELKEALKTNDRVPAFVDNLSQELKKAEMSGVKLDRIKIKQTVYSMTEFFIKCVEAKADEQTKSDLEKARIKAANRDPLDNNGNGDLTEEFGVKIVDG